jgi:pimeloyl-ACP methyl ester carboxylesterase
LFYWRWLVSLTLILLVVTSAQAQTNNVVPRIEATDCGFDWWDDTIMCADLIVPEDRTNPDSPTIRLRFTVIPPYGDNVVQDPVVYLEGGPGGDLLPYMPMSYGVVAPFNEKRTVVLFDQRGTGFSRPGLDCPEYDNTLYELLGEDVTSDVSRQRVLDALSQCKRRLESRGVNIAAYNSAENAADLEDLRRVLGYSEWNLYGISYGTRLALTAMRDQPEGIRSVILDSVVPLEVSLYDDMSANLDRALNVLFLDCTLDEACNTAYPRLGTIFYDTVTQLNSNPGEVRINHPTTRMEYTVRIDGNQLIGLAFGALYSPSWFALLPAIIYDTYRGDYSLLASTLESVLEDQEGFSMGMHFAVQCSEEAPFATREGVMASLNAFPALQSYFETEANTGTMVLNICEQWTGRPPAAHENAPVISDIPTLVQSGQYDPITPPRWGAMVADSLSNSFNFEYRALGHGASVSDLCPLLMALEFIDDPSQTPDDDCMEEMEAPYFFIADESLNLVAFTDDEQRIRSVRPESWEGWGSAYFPVSMDDTFLRFGSLEVREYNPTASAEYIVDYLLNDIAAEFDVYDLPPPIENRSANGFQWAIYEFRRGDRYLYFASATRDTRVYWVLMVTDRFEKDNLYLNVFTPAIDNLEAF